MPDGQYQADPTQPTETGLKITELLVGPAKAANLRAGDIILGVGPTRTQTFEELQKALAASTDKTEIVFINGDDKKVEKIPLVPNNGKIGVAVVPVNLN